MRVPTSGLVVHEAKLKNDPGQIKPLRLIRLAPHHTTACGW